MVDRRPPGADDAPGRRRGRGPVGHRRSAARHRLARAPLRRHRGAARGSTLLLFTDGLFERRGMLLDEGRDRLRDVLGACAGLDLDRLCDRLLAEMLGDGVEDDVAVLAVRAHPVGAGRPAEAGPEVLPPAVPHPV
ncbi:SpoIIE family protein phosphatase [Blastococcus brunescens]|uniref:SpoIIE family protein phosphatase n=1 Tax=Blastococcus brunescens TaxID=1564165 RepID=UPI003BEEF10D